MNDERFDVAIVGAGFCGTMVAVQLLRSRKHSLSIALIEKSADCGLGLAYRTEDPQHLLNVVAGRMSAFPEDPDHFLNWLAGEEIVAEFGSFVPRMVYGRYLRSCLSDAVANARTFHRIQFECAQVTSIDVVADGARLTLSGSEREQLLSQRVVLALGNMPPRAPRPFAEGQIELMEFRGKAPTTRAVVLVGAGLTAVDAVLSVSASQPEAKIYVLSRRGLAPRPHRKPRAGGELPGIAAMPKPGTGVREAVREVRAVVAGLEDVEGDWRAVIDSLRQVTEHFWRQFSPKDQARFLRHVRPFWDVHRHRVAPQIGERLVELLDSGRVQFLGGYIDSVEQAGDRYGVAIRARRSGEVINIQVDRVMNCTGSRFDVRDPMVRQLVDRGNVTVSHTRLGLRTDLRGALVDAAGAPSSTLFTLGPPCLGDLWESIAVPELRLQAQGLAERLIELKAGSK